MLAMCTVRFAASRKAADLDHVVAQAMQEVGIDLSNQQPQKLTAELASTANLLITMGCGEACPHVPGMLSHPLMRWDHLP